METDTMHYWPEASTEERKVYWGYYPFEVGVLYYINVWIKEDNGSGIFWVENGDELWMPCPPHTTEG
jgi:hypothetical protein